MISIIVPVYNGERYLERCLNSIICQSYRDYEIILVNDGSTDNSLMICNKYAIDYSFIRLIHQENGGVSSARNRGIEIAKGEYITFIDADDWIEEEYLERLLKPMIHGGMVACKLGAKSLDVEPRSGDSTVKDLQLSILSLTGVQGAPCCKIFDTQILHENRIRFDEKITICEDLLFALQYSSYITKNVVILPACGYHYEVNENGAMYSLYRKEKYRESNLSVYRAFEKAEPYLLSGDRQVHRLWKIRKAKYASDCLRMMLAGEDIQDDFWCRCLKETRKNLLLYVVMKEAPIQCKISMLLTAISPRFEYYIWKKLH